MLRPFEVRPKQIRIGEESRRGFNFDQFADAFARYLPPPQEVKQVKQVKQPHRIAMRMFQMFQIFR